MALLVAPAVGIRAGTLARFSTVFGTLEVELFDPDRPLTVRNFIRYVESGRYQDSIFHRCPVVNPVTLRSDFVIQGGGVHVAGSGTDQWLLKPVEPFPEIPNEYAVGPARPNAFGTLAMAKRAGDTNSASSQWFFNLRDNPELDAADTNNLFVVFGRVWRGIEVLERFKSFHLYTGRETSNAVVNWGFAPFQEVPMLVPPNPVSGEIRETSLLHVDISLLSVGVRLLPGSAPEVSWRSVADRTNVVEATTRFPAGWEPLVTTNGNGDLFRFADAQAPMGGRFYRVRVSD